MRGNSSKYDPVQLLLFFTENPFPVKEIDYYGGSWWSWLERIKEGQNAEQDRLAKLQSDMPEEFADWYADDWKVAEDVSRQMYAALTVAIIANIESFYHQCMLICEQFSGVKIGKRSAHEYKNVKEYFIRSINLHLDTCDNSLVVKSIRGLQNAYKHNNGKYMSTSRSKIYPALAKKWNLIDGESIQYSKLPFDELLFASGKYCASLLEKVRCASGKR